MNPGPSSDEFAGSPRERVRLLMSRIGEQAVATWCAELLSGAVEPADPHRPPIAWLGGRHAVVRLRNAGFAGTSQAYWPRVWAARGLLYAWDPAAELAVVGGLRDSSWRVREMSAKVARRRVIARAESGLATLLDHPVARVRAAAEAALEEIARVTESRRSSSGNDSSPAPHCDRNAQ